MKTQCAKRTPASILRALLPNLFINGLSVTVAKRALLPGQVWWSTWLTLDTGVRMLQAEVVSAIATPHEHHYVCTEVLTDDELYEVGNATLRTHIKGMEEALRVKVMAGVPPMSPYEVPVHAIFQPNLL